MVNIKQFTLFTFPKILFILLIIKNVFKKSLDIYLKKSSSFRMIFSFLLRPADAVQFVTEEPPTLLFSFFLHETNSHSYKSKWTVNSQNIICLAKIFHYLFLFDHFDKVKK